jgi:hypothetical protein
MSVQKLCRGQGRLNLTLLGGFSQLAIGFGYLKPMSLDVRGFGPSGRFLGLLGLGKELHLATFARHAAI